MLQCVAFICRKRDGISESHAATSLAWVHTVGTCWNSYAFDLHRSRVAVCMCFILILLHVRLYVLSIKRKPENFFLIKRSGRCWKLIRLFSMLAVVQWGVAPSCWNSNFFLLVFFYSRETHHHSSLPFTLVAFSSLNQYTTKIQPSTKPTHDIIESPACFCCASNYCGFPQAYSFVLTVRSSSSTTTFRLAIQLFEQNYLIVVYAFL